MWKSGKKWLYTASVLVMVAGAFSGLTDTLMMPSQVLSAATTSSGTVSPGTTANAPDVSPFTTPASNTYSIWNNLFSSTDGYTSQALVGTAANNTAGGFSTFTTTRSYTTNDAATAMLAPAVDLSKSFSLTIAMKAYNAYGWSYLGDNMGIMLMPQNTSSLTNFNPRTLAGVPNTVFIGRSLQTSVTAGQPITTASLGNASDTTQGSPSATNVNNLIVATTDGTGTAATVQSVNLSNWLMTSGSADGDGLAVTWSETSYNAANNTVTGSFTYTLNTDTFTTASMTLPRNMTVGLTASTGLQTWTLTQSMSIRAFNGTPASAPVDVNYVNAVTGSIIASSAAIVVALSNSVGIVAPTATISDANSYDYVAATPAGYTFKGLTTTSGLLSATASSASVTVSDLTSSGTDPNQVYDIVSPNYQQAHVWFSAAAGTVLPASMTSEYSSPASGAASAGMTDGSIYASSAQAWTSSAVAEGASLSSAGYSVSYVYDGISYATLSAAYAADMGATGSMANTYTAYTNTGSSYAATIGTAGQLTNDVLAVVSANSQSANFNYQWASGTPGVNGTSGTLISGSMPGTATTASLLPSNVADAGQTGNKIPMPTPFSSATGPDDNYYQAAVTGADGYIYTVNGTTTNSDGSVTINYTRTLNGVADATPPVVTIPFANTKAGGATGNNQYDTGNYSWYALYAAYSDHSTYTVGTNAFNVTFAAKTASVSWYYGSATASGYTAVGNSYASSTAAIGSPLSQTANSSAAPSGYWWDGNIGYSDSYSAAVDPVSATYSSWNALSAAEPYVFAGTTNIYKEVQKDQTSIAAVSSETVALGQLSAAGSWSPAMALTNLLNYDGTSGTASAVNSAAVMVTITNSVGSAVWSGAATSAVLADNLPAGTYTVTYTTTANYTAGQSAITNNAKSASTVLTITDFALPFTGGDGMAGMIGLAAATGTGAVLVKKRRQTDAAHSTKKLRISLKMSVGEHQRWGP